MIKLIDKPGSALALGGAITLAVLAAWMMLAGADRLGLLSFLLRWLHVFAGIVWLGMIWFVNFVQIAAMAEADEPTRSGLMRHVVPRVAAAFRHASHLNLVTGLAMLVTAGYVLDVTAAGSAAYVPPLRNLLLWGGTFGGIVMWALVHFAIWPGLRIVLGHAEGDKAAARERVRTFARINLVLSVPVTFVMVAAAHLY